MSNRQERRRAERDAKKENGRINPLLEKMPLRMIQPWSVPVLHTKLPDEILQKMIDISDSVIDDKKSLSNDAFDIKVIDPSSCCLCSFSDGKNFGTLRYITAEI